MANRDETMSAKHPNSLWDKIHRGRHGKMTELGGPAWNRLLCENPNMSTLEYIARFRHHIVGKSKSYFRSALIKR